MRICAAGVEARRRDAVGSQSLADEKHDPEGLLHHPMAEIKHAEGDKDRQAKERQESGCAISFNR